jgi:hypothetical protein
MDKEGPLKSLLRGLEIMVSIYFHISTIYSAHAAHSNNYTSMITSRISNTKEKKNTGAVGKEQPIEPP